MICWGPEETENSTNSGTKSACFPKTIPLATAARGAPSRGGLQRFSKGPSAGGAPGRGMANRRGRAHWCLGCLLAASQQAFQLLCMYYCFQTDYVSKSLIDALVCTSAVHLSAELLDCIVVELLLLIRVWINGGKAFNRWQCTRDHRSAHVPFFLGADWIFTRSGKGTNYVFWLPDLFSQNWWTILEG